jgi:hypothetical protein
MPASHFDVKAMTGRPKFIVRHSTTLFLDGFKKYNSLSSGDKSINNTNPLISSATTAT